MTREWALQSGLGEAIEIASMCRWGDEAVFPARQADLPGAAWSPSEIAGFSSEQLENRAHWNDRLAGTDKICDFAKDTEIDWIKARGIDGGMVWIPADAVLLSEAKKDGAGLFCRADTNGCAAGRSDAEARSAALFELIERDAVGRWWYGRRARPSLPASIIGAESHALLGRLSEIRVRTVLIDLTTNLKVPVVAAAGETERGAVALGFSAASTYCKAAQSALEEMAKMLLVLWPGKGGGALRPGLARWVKEVNFTTAPLSLVASGPYDPPEPPHSIGTLLQDNGIRVAFIERTRPELGVPVWRAMSPDLCHWKPRFGRARLLAEDQMDVGPVATNPNPTLLRM